MVTPDLEAQRVFNGFYSIGSDAYKLKKSNHYLIDMFRYKRVRQHETTASLFHM
jgi:hypothetical protein